MQQVKQGLWLSEERIKQRRRDYFASKKSMAQWLKSLFEKEAKETPKKKDDLV